jgi:hypothetical protein
MNLISRVTAAGAVAVITVLATSLSLAEPPALGSSRPMPRTA